MQFLFTLFCFITYKQVFCLLVFAIKVKCLKKQMKAFQSLRKVLVFRAYYKEPREVTHRVLALEKQEL